MTALGTNTDYEVAIIGAGPAGLSAAAACIGQGRTPIVIDQGLPILSRRASSTKEIAEGVGGAGLFSDGKFSFYPAASSLWKTIPTPILIDSYNWLSGTLARYSFPSPDFPSKTDPRDTDPTVVTKGGVKIRRKEYLSSRMPEHLRTQLVLDLATSCSTSLITRRRLTKIKEVDGSGQLEVETADTNTGASTMSYTVDGVILATGKLGSLHLQGILDTDQIHFVRIEVGIRLEQSHTRFFLRNEKSIDPKLIWKSPSRNMELRTFCCCHPGEVLTVDSHGLLTVSGRGNTESEKSNVGILVRYADDENSAKALGQLLDAGARLEMPVKEQLTHFLDCSTGKVPHHNSKVIELLGPYFSSDLADGLSCLLDHFGRKNFDDAIIHAPAIEGVGYYPATNKNLRIRNLPIWIAGDVTGAFRGLAAAMISGYSSGLEFCRS